MLHVSMCLLVRPKRGLSVCDGDDACGFENITSTDPTRSLNICSPSKKHRPGQNVQSLVQIVRAERNFYGKA